MLASRPVREVRINDRITVQTPDGLHAGRVLSPPTPRKDLAVSMMSVHLACQVCSATPQTAVEHPVVLPTYRLIAVDRSL